MCSAIYIGNTQQTFNKRMDGHFSHLQRLRKNGHKSYSFPAYLIQHFNTTTSCTDLRKYTTFKVVKQLNPIGAMNTFTKPNCNLCMQERLTILNNLNEKHVTVMNNNHHTYGSCRNKMTFRWCFLSTDNPILPGERVRPLKGS